MRQLLIIFLISRAITASSQQVYRDNQVRNKPVIDSAAIAQWPVLGNFVDISGNGNYFFYTIDNLPQGSSTLVVKNTKSSWEERYIGGSDAAFSKDDSTFVFRRNDTIFLLSLFSRQLKTIIGVDVFRQLQSLNESWLLYSLSSNKGSLYLFNLSKGSIVHFDDVSSYRYSPISSCLAICKRPPENKNGISILLMNLESKSTLPIYSTAENKDSLLVAQMLFGDDGKSLAFVTNLFKRQPLERVDSETTIWLYSSKFRSARQVFKGDDAQIPMNFRLYAVSSVNTQEDRLLLSIKPNPILTVDSSLSSVNIWSYKDLVLNPEQRRTIEEQEPEYMAILDINTHIFRQIQFYNENPPYPLSSNYTLIKHQFIEPWIKTNISPYVDIVSLKENGKRIRLTQNFLTLDNYSFSPTDSILVYFDKQKKSYLSYNLKSKQYKNLTGTTNTNFVDEYGYENGSVAPIDAWITGTNEFIAYDNNDLWVIDAEGKLPPKNVTNGFGRKNHMRLRMVYGRRGFDNTVLVNKEDTVLLTAFSTTNKNNGFFRVNISKCVDPESLVFSPATFFRVESQKANTYSFDDGMCPIKASSINIWLVKSETSTDAPNYFTTDDFKTFVRQSDLQPQRNYNWLTSELITWTQLDGSKAQGILYKPENFDQRKAYPLIFNYYEQLSHRLYEFPPAEFTSDNINIPWFVSRGYLVFTPDIAYKFIASGGTTGECAFNSIISAANFLAKKSFVDSNAMAVQGHSFGGGETNYLVTHSNRFAAAAEVAGVSDPISAYLTLVPIFSKIETFSKQYQTEHSHLQYGASPWERPDLYRRESAVLNAKDVKTPLLIMHNEQDNSIQWRQGIELYMAFRRLGKKVWMLQYDNGYHAVDGKDAVDYTIRLTQFFDYYLKHTKPPAWMTKGIPASAKHVESGYELDNSNAIP